MTKKILLVDDRENVRGVLRDIFETLGYTVVPNSMFGFEVCRQIKQVKKLSTKVIIYTGTLAMVDAVKARRMGADDYIIKGEDPELLIKAVKEQIG